MFTAGFSRRCTGGVREFEIEAKNLRGVIREMDKLHPSLGHYLEEKTTVAIDGQIHETAYFQPIRPAARISSSPSSKGVSVKDGRSTELVAYLGQYPDVPSRREGHAAAVAQMIAHPRDTHF